jgi:hypothetical protein
VVEGYKVLLPRKGRDKFVAGVRNRSDVCHRNLVWKDPHGEISVKVNVALGGSILNRCVETAPFQSFSEEGAKSQANVPTLPAIPSPTTSSLSAG